MSTDIFFNPIWDVRMTDTSLRDGSHHKRHQFTKDEVGAIVAALVGSHPAAGLPDLSSLTPSFTSAWDSDFTIFCERSLSVSISARMVSASCRMRAACSGCPRWSRRRLPAPCC